MISSLTIIVIIVAMDYSNYNYVYRDDSIEKLTYKVREGVYAGIYTTETRSQDLQTQYHECGQFYIFRNDAFRIQKDTTMEKSIPYIIDPVESQDIDNESDWLLAELKYRFLTEQGILK